MSQNEWDALDMRVRNLDKSPVKLSVAAKELAISVLREHLAHEEDKLEAYRDFAKDWAIGIQEKTVQAAKEALAFVEAH